MWPTTRLSTAQTNLIERWLGVPEVLEDLSWGVVDTAVLHLRSDRGEHIVKAAGPANHHIGREITAHESHTGPLVELGAAARLQWASREANLLITEYLPGSLVEGTAHEYEGRTYVQAGRLLRKLHSGAATTDADCERLATEKSLRWLAGPHRIEPEGARRARQILSAYETEPVTVVPTHGDWQPRNWLEHAGDIRVIDFGRFALRPAETDLCRLAVQQWREAPELETAFLDGYGSDPRDGTRWPVMMLREAIGTAAWAFQVHDEAFEKQGLRMLEEALERFA